MPPTTPTVFCQAWLKWKALKLPWRKRFLVGLDLEGNTFWQFRDTFSSHKHRMRRIVQYPPSTHYSEIKISPQWHQWLRHTRNDAPSLTEQSQDLVRQQNLKVLAAQADARWAAKPSFLDGPERSQTLPATDPRDEGGYNESARTEAESGVSNAVSGIENASAGMQETVKTQTQQEGGEIPQDELEPTRGERNKLRPVAEQPDDPWKQARRGPSEEWQPQAWDGSSGARKRA